jgi:cobalt/nickel transport system ATP-binding protein
MEEMIRLEDVHFSYSSRPILKNVNFSIREGDRIGLVGPIGSGKTTLLRLIVGLLRPTNGVIWAFGKQRRCEPDFYDVRERVGFMFQDSNQQLFCPAVLEDVAFGPLNQGKSKEEAKRLASSMLKLVGLEGFEDRLICKLSCGEKRLVSLASVLAMQPNVLLLDEPTNGLDDSYKSRIINVLKTLPQSMVIVSHESEFISNITSNLMKVSSGSVVLHGTPK